MLEEKKHMRIWGAYPIMTPGKTHISTASTFTFQAIYLQETSL